MKKIFKKFELIILTALTVWGLNSCKSTQLEASSLGKTVIFSVTGNAKLPWYEMDQNGKLKSTGQGLFGTVFSDKSFENLNKYGAIDRLDFAEETLRNVFLESLNVQILEKENVVNSKKYKNLSSQGFNSLNNFVAATDYKAVESPKKFGATSLLKELEADSGIVLSYRFYREKIKGTKANGQSGAYILMKASIYDKNGEKIYSKNYEGRSADTAISEGGEVEIDKLYDLYNEVIENLIYQFAADLK